MIDIEQKALALVREVLAERNLSDKRAVRREVSPYTEALCRAIEQHEAFKQEVSDAVQAYVRGDVVWPTLEDFIIPNPDPLVEAMADCGVDRFESWADQLRAALEARGLTITTKEKD